MNQKSSLFALLFTIFNDAIGWGIVLTIFAPLLFDPANGILPADTSDAARNLILGILISSYAITQFLSMPIIGALADHFGRKKLLEWTIFGNIASFFFSAVAIWMANLPLLFAARLLSGLFSANSAIAQASIADVSSEREKSKNLALGGMVGGIAWIVGPPLGGILSTPRWIPWFDFATPFLALASLFVLNYFWVHTGFQETYQPQEKTDWKHEIKNLRKVASMPWMKGWLSVAFLYDLGWFFFLLYYPQLFVQKFHFDQEGIGFFSAYLSLFWLLGSFVLNRWLGDLHPAKILFSVMPVLGILISLGNWEDTISGWSWTFPLLGLGGTLAWTSIMAQISNLSGKENQGKAFGVLQSISSLALLIAPFVSGIIAAENIELPMYLGSIILIIAGFYALVLHSKRSESV